jgi:metal-dependent amidase/aminoacylase/carboxypeptidase family protein
VHILSEIEAHIKREQPTKPPFVVAFGKFIAQGKCNVICDTAKIEGTVRTYNEAWRERIHHIIKETTEQVAKEQNAQVIVDIRRGYPVLNNGDKATEFVKQCAMQYLDNDKVIELPPRMTADDFAFFLQKVQGCYYRLGVTAAGNAMRRLHTADFDIDEEALKTGMGLMCWIALNALSEPLSAW